VYEYILGKNGERKNEAVTIGTSFSSVLQKLITLVQLFSHEVYLIYINSVSCSNNLYVLVKDQAVTSIRLQYHPTAVLCKGYFVSVGDMSVLHRLGASNRHSGHQDLHVYRASNRHSGHQDLHVYRANNRDIPDTKICMCIEQVTKTFRTPGLERVSGK
jgi:hypothetical protein